MEKYYLKSYLDIYKSNKYIYIGAPFYKKSSKILNNKKNLEYLKKLVYDGITNPNKNSYLFNKFYKNNMLTIQKNKDSHENRINSYFDFLDIPFDNKILDKKILIFGCGGGGSSLAYLLAQFGFKKITIIDSDIVNETDVRKVMVFRKENLKRKKVVALSEIVFKNFNVFVDPVDSMPESELEILKLIKEFSPTLVIKACDPAPDFRKKLNKICFENNVNYTQLAYSYKNIYIGPTYIPGKTSCDNGYEKLLMNLYGEDMLYNSMSRLFETQVIHPSISFNINIVANLLLKDILFLFLNKQKLMSSIGTLLCLDPLIMKGFTYKITCDKTCNICNGISD